MKLFTLICRSLVFHRRTHGTVFLATCASTAILVGALVIGDSVRYSLKRLAIDRLGSTEIAVTADERFFRSHLADDLSRSLGTDTAPVLQLRGIGINSESGLRVNGINIVGVDDRFWKMGNAQEHFPYLGAEKACINQHCASRLDVRNGDQVLLRIERPNSMPWEMPFSSRRNPSIAVRVTVEKIISDDSFGHFSLKSNQTAPLNLFLSLAWLGKTAVQEERANIILIAGRHGSGVSVEGVRSLIKTNWQLPDAGLELRSYENANITELISERVFLDPPMVEAAFRSGYNPKGILSYFVNELVCGKKTTPYSFVSAPGSPLIPADMPDDRVIINDWLAEDLGASPGDFIRLSYYVPGPGQMLEEKFSDFQVLKVVPIEGPASDRALMPNFPGLSGVVSCRDWNPGTPINLKKIREKDERYWNVYRGTPKAFVTLSAAQKMWKNRFGDLTAVRYSGNREASDTIAHEILQNLDPAAIGIKVTPIREVGIRAGSGAVDFGQLFLGLSVFLIASSLIITALLFAFNIANRAEETGTLLALGFTPSLIRRALLIEGGLIAVSGSIAGAILGLLYNRALLYGLNTVWRGAVGFSSLEVYLKIHTIAFGIIAGAAIALITMWFVLRKQGERLPAQLQRSGMYFDTTGGNVHYWTRIATTGFCMIGISLLIVIAGAVKEGRATGLFFAAGALLMSGSLTVCYAFLVKMQGATTKVHMTIPGLGIRGFARRPKRSLAVAGILACGIFIVFSVSANRNYSIQGAGKRESGTGGFAFFAETTLPIHGDLNDEKTIEKYGITSLEGEKAGFVHMRVYEGEDASCLNLNKVQNPRILGVRPQELAERGSFTFIKTVKRPKGENPWLLLNGKDGADMVRAICDQTVMTWGLHKSLGNTLSYTDERGKEFKLKLVGGLKDSIFQGSVIISEEAFIERFPSVSGSRVLLVDTPQEKSEMISQNMRKAFQDFGIEVVPAVQRLAEFTKVQNTYLSIYLLLGGLGLILGSFGSGFAVLRNVLERRGELAILRAVGFTRHSLRLIVYLEHLFMLAVGIACGSVSALIAVMPVLLSQGTGLPFMFILILLPAIVAVSFGWTFLATLLAMRGDPLPALRNE